MIFWFSIFQCYLVKVIIQTTKYSRARFRNQFPQDEFWEAGSKPVFTKLYILFMYSFAACTKNEFGYFITFMYSSIAYTNEHIRACLFVACIKHEFVRFLTFLLTRTNRLACSFVVLLCIRSFLAQMNTTVGNHCHTRLTFEFHETRSSRFLYPVTWLGFRTYIPGSIPFPAMRISRARNLYRLSTRVDEWIFVSAGTPPLGGDSPRENH